MTPDKLVDWSISITICVIILSITGIQDWLANIFGRKSSVAKLEAKVAPLESRLEKLEGLQAKQASESA